MTSDTEHEPAQTARSRMEQITTRLAGLSADEKLILARLCHFSQQHRARVNDMIEALPHPWPDHLRQTFTHTGLDVNWVKALAQHGLFRQALGLQVCVRLALLGCLSRHLPVGELPGDSAELSTVLDFLDRHRHRTDLMEILVVLCTDVEGNGEALLAIAEALIAERLSTPRVDEPVAEPQPIRPAR